MGANPSNSGKLVPQDSCIDLEDAEIVVRSTLGTSAILYRMPTGRADLKASLERPMRRDFGHVPFRTPLEQAGALMESINLRHPLLDGNKRISWSLSIFFLETRGYLIQCDQEEAADFVLKSIAEKMDAQKIAGWMIDRI